MRHLHERHRLDGFSLLAGVLFLVLGVLVLVDEVTGVDISGRWLVALLLVGLGLAAALGSLVWPRREDDAGQRGSTRENPV